MPSQKAFEYANRATRIIPISEAELALLVNLPWKGQRVKMAAAITAECSFPVKQPEPGNLYGARVIVEWVKDDKTGEVHVLWLAVNETLGFSVQARTLEELIERVKRALVSTEDFAKAFPQNAGADLPPPATPDSKDSTPGG